MSQELPLKSIPGAIFFTLFFGPIGLLYTSVMGAIVMMVFLLVAMGSHQHLSVLTVWMACCVWTVMAANRTNRALASHQPE